MDKMSVGSKISRASRFSRVKANDKSINMSKKSSMSISDASFGGANIDPNIERFTNYSRGSNEDNSRIRKKSRKVTPDEGIELVNNALQRQVNAQGGTIVMGQRIPTLLMAAAVTKGDEAELQRDYHRDE